MAAAKKTGRPLKDHAPGEMVNVTVQISSEMKSELQKRAEAAGRSLSAEVILALRRETESPVMTCERLFGERGGRVAAWIGWTLKLIDLTRGSTTKITVRKADLDAVRQALKAIEAEATIVAGEAS